MALTDQVLQQEQQQGIPEGLLLSVLRLESGLKPDARSVNQGGSAPGSVDRGIAQINDYWHPDVSDAEAYDPQFAIPWAANYLRQQYDRCGSWRGALSAYNTGRCQVINEYPNLVMDRWDGTPDSRPAQAAGTTATTGEPAPLPPLSEFAEQYNLLDATSLTIGAALILLGLWGMLGG